VSVASCPMLLLLCYDRLTPLTRRLPPAPLRSWDTVLDDSNIALKNPFDSAKTLGQFWGTFTLKFLAIFERLVDVENHEFGEAMVFGGTEDGPFCIFLIIHNLNIIGEAVLNAAGNLTKVKGSNSTQTTSALDPDNFSEEIFWEVVVGSFEVDNGKSLNLVKDGLLRNVSSVVSRELLRHRYYLDVKVQVRRERGVKRRQGWNEATAY